MRRFTDVKSMLIKQYELMKQQHKDLTVSEPALMALDVNYRSHAGILDVGNAIVSVVRQLSPLTIDRYVVQCWPTSMNATLLSRCPCMAIQHPVNLWLCSCRNCSARWLFDLVVCNMLMVTV